MATADRAKGKVDGPSGWCGTRAFIARRSDAKRGLKTPPTGILVLGMMCLAASNCDARRWPAGGATQPWQLWGSGARRLLQAGSSAGASPSSADQAPATPVLYDQVLKQTDRSSGSLAEDGYAVVVARVIQPPPPPPPRGFVPTGSSRGALSPQAIFVGIAFGTFIACCICMFLIWRTMETTDWGQVRERLSKWLGLPLARQQETLVSSLNGEHAEGTQAGTGAAEATAADTDSAPTGGQLSRTASQSPHAAAVGASPAVGTNTNSHTGLAQEPLEDSHLGRETEERHARGLLAAGRHSECPLSHPEVDGGATGGATAEVSGHPAGCRLPGQLAASSDSSHGAEAEPGLQVQAAGGAAGVVAVVGHSSCGEGAQPAPLPAACPAVTTQGAASAPGA